MYSMNYGQYPFMGPQMPQQPGFPGQQSPFQPTGMNLHQPQQQAATQQTGPDWIPVTDIKQVEQVQVVPGGKAWVMLQNEPVFALRVADQMGLVTTSYYRFEKIDPEAVSAPAQSSEYVTRAEFQQFINSLRAPIAEPQAAQVEKEAVTK